MFWCGGKVWRKNASDEVFIPVWRIFAIGEQCSLLFWLMITYI